MKIFDKMREVDILFYTTIILSWVVYIIYVVIAAMTKTAIIISILDILTYCLIMMIFFKVFEKDVVYEKEEGD